MIPYGQNTDMSLRSRRQQPHARMATTLEGQFHRSLWPNPRCSPGTARKPGRRRKPAAIHRLQAGQQAIARSAMMEAVAQLRKRLDVLADRVHDL
jgi:hypothetical protein